MVNNYQNEISFLMFLKELSDNNINFIKSIDIRIKSSQKGLMSIGNMNTYEYLYKVLDKDIIKFLEIAKNNNISFISIRIKKVN